MSAAEIPRFSLREKVVIYLTAALSLAASLLVPLATATPIAIFEGFTASGMVSLLRYELRVGGEEVTLRPLESVSFIAYVLWIGAAALAALSLASIGIVSRKQAEATLLELVPASACIASLNLTILYSLLRVTIDDVLPYIPTKYSVRTAAGSLILHSASSAHGWPYVLYTRYRLLLILSAAMLLALAAASLYIILRKEGGRA